METEGTYTLIGSLYGAEPLGILALLRDVKDHWKIIVANVEGEALIY